MRRVAVVMQIRYDNPPLMNQCSSALFHDNTVLSQMAPYPEKMHKDLSEGKLCVDSFEGNPKGKDH